MNRSREAGAGARRPPWWATGLEGAWLLLLIVPAATTLAESGNGDVRESVLFFVSCWLIVGLRLLVTHRLFCLLTFPAALAGVLCTGASFLRHVDLLELTIQWRSYSALDIAGALRPYAWIVTGVVVGVLALCAAVYRHAASPAVRWRQRLAVAAVTAGLAVALPATTWVRAWPLNALLVGVTVATGSNALARSLFPQASSGGPRDPNARWHAVRRADAPRAETVVFVIGETVRADYLRECRGPDRVRPFAAGSLVACDVVSGSDATMSSVPLMVSREMPGQRVPVSNDATFARALGEAGFETHWFGVQGPAVAWADAEDLQFPAVTDAGDIPMLLPPLASALSGAAPLKAVVLHANNAHDPYCARYDPAHAPYAAACLGVGVQPNASNIGQVRHDYANAVDASVGFVNAVIAQLERRPEPAFLVFSPDHGENLLDDGRLFWGHALRRPTRWDTRVPAVFWANAAWRSAHADGWKHLASQIDRPLMHADLVPTIMAAADVRYDEPRAAAVDLLAHDVPPRRRIVQQSYGMVVDSTDLDAEARAAGPGPR